jgi:diguanylate cyclase (GGDEF)-like protein/PAS domain S-box-containing protein
MDSTGAGRPSNRRRYVPSDDARQLAHELALVTGRLVRWSYDRRTGALWWSDDIASTFHLDAELVVGDGRTGADLGRWLVDPVLAGAVATPGPETDFELYRAVNDHDGEDIVLLVRARPVPSSGELAGVIADVTERRAAELALHDLVDRYRLLVDLSPDAIVVHQMGELRFVNPAGVRYAGLRDAAEIVGRPITDFVHRESIAAMVARISALTEPGAVSEPAEARIVRADGSEMLVESTSVRTTWAGEPAFQVILRDITERRAAEQRFAVVVNALDEGVVMVGADGQILVVNNSARAMLGPAVDEAISGFDLLLRLAMFTEDGKPLPPAGHPAVIAMTTGVPQLDVIVGFDDADGHRRWASTNSQPLRAAGSTRVEGVVCSFTDISRQREADLRLWYQATHDPLTGLANRAVVLAELQRRLDGEDRSDGPVALLFVDLDRFKAVNDSLGHLSADEFLVVIGARLVALAPSAALVGRLAGDEFVVILDEVDDIDDAIAVADHVGKVISEPAHLSTGHTAAVTASIGVALGDGTTLDAEALLRSADAAMYRAKQQGRCRVEAYDEALGARIRHRLELQNALRLAMDAGEIVVHFQPITHLLTGRVVGFEALARWPHETLGWIPPEDFIPVAERSGLILRLGDHVLTDAVAEFARWRAGRADRAHLYLSVNMSNRQLTSSTVEQVGGVLEAGGLEPGALWLEMTESALVIDPDRAGHVLSQLRRMGVHLAIDDFGTGYSSLLSLKRYPVELVKIDRSFIEGLGTDPDSDAIVLAVIRLAQSLNLNTIAEGVETEIQHARLVELGCALAQGFRLGEPGPLTPE